MNDMEERDQADHLSSSPRMKLEVTLNHEDCGSGEKIQAGDERVEKRGPYIMSKNLAFHIKLQKHRDAARKILQKRSFGSDWPVFQQPRHKPKTMKFNKGYTALSQTEDFLVALDSDSDTELDCSSGYSSAEVHPDLSRQLLKDGYHLDEIPDDEDLDLILPKAMSSSLCCCSDASSCCVQ